MTSGKLKTYVYRVNDDGTLTAMCFITTNGRERGIEVSLKSAAQFHCPVMIDRYPPTCKIPVTNLGKLKKIREIEIPLGMIEKEGE